MSVNEKQNNNSDCVHISEMVATRAQKVNRQSCHNVPASITMIKIFVEQQSIKEITYRIKTVINKKYDNDVF